MGNSLALCMMVKNEQQFLPYCLASVYQNCDEIIIVDTGSTDRTVEIAEAFGAYVIHAPWKNDFSLIRNISQSPAKSDWIIWLDGDEVLNESGIKKIKQQLLYDNSVDFYLLPRANFWKDLHHVFAYPDSQYKIYRNNIGLQWHGAIHEHIYDDRNSNHKKKLKNTDVHTFHYAYVKSTEEVRKKMALYIGIENPTMDKRKIENCSTEHSFFQEKNPNEVQEYSGQYPEIFDKLEVTENEIKWKDGKTIVRYKSEQVFIPSISKKSAEFDDSEQKLGYKKDLCSIIIATYNKVEYLSQCVDGIYQSTNCPFELIIVNNGSTEKSLLDYLGKTEKQYSNFKCIDLNRNLGFAKGYNEGVKASRGEWLCILNNDVQVTENWLSKMIEHLRTNPEYGLIGPVSNNIHGEHQMIKAPQNYTFGDYITLVANIVENMPQRLVESSWVTGCVMVMHKSILAELAKVTSPPRNGILFCEDFEIGCSEDSDLGFTIQHRLHKKLGVTRDTFIWHWGQRTLQDNLEWRTIQEKNNQILKKRWPEIFPNG